MKKEEKIIQIIESMGSPIGKLPLWYTLTHTKQQIAETTFNVAKVEIIREIKRHYIDKK